MMFTIAATVFSISCIQLAISQCPQNCQSCSDTNQCSSCKIGHWGTNFVCLNTCSNNCTNSNCDDNGYCFACVTGKYGPNCNQDCQLCKNGECGIRECTSGCKIGYYQYISGDYSYCYPCPDNCQQCQNFTYCTFCDTGYYIFKYMYTLTTEQKRTVATCTSCQSNTVCDYCSKLPNCLQCSYWNGTLACEHCVEGYMLNNNQCVKNIPCGINNYCLNGCSTSGGCNGCIDGRTGNDCDYLCDGMCSKCPQFDHNLCQACKNGFYTRTCDISCSQNCATWKCDFYNGSCLNGCLSGFWGDKCEYICSDHCKQSECNRDGTCSHGCTIAYGGLYCNITMGNASTTLSTSSISSAISSTQRESSTKELTVGTCNCQEGGSISEAVLGGVVTGAVLITALLVGSIALFMYRRLASKSGSKEQRSDTMYYNMSVRSTANDETGFNNIIMASEMRTNQTPEISVYDKLSRTNTEHEYSGL